MKQVFLLLFISFTLLFASCKKQADPIPKPIAAFSISYQANGSVYLYNESKNATSYQWELSDGRKTIETSPTINFSDNGDYNLKLTAKGDGGYDSAERTVQIRNMPTTGTNVFWSNSQKSIDIYVNGVFRGTTSKYYLDTNNAPNCGVEGSVTVELPAGVYSCSAKTRELFPTTWSGEVRFTNGQCRTYLFKK